MSAVQQIASFNVRIERRPGAHGDYYAARLCGLGGRLRGALRLRGDGRTEREAVQDLERQVLLACACHVASEDARSETDRPKLFGDEVPPYLEPVVGRVEWVPPEVSKAAEKSFAEHASGAPATGAAARPTGGPGGAFTLIALPATFDARIHRPDGTQELVYIELYGEKPGTKGGAA